jgi:ATP-dependent RNA helicase DeaD
METHSFEDLALSPAVMRAITELGFEEPTPIQALSIPVIMAGKDVIGQAHTGTGKTAAFGIPIIERADAKDRRVQAIVLCPTRELAIQTSEELAKLAKHRKGFTILPVYGGQPIERQIAALRAGVTVVIATPGRLLDHLRRRSLSLDGVRMIVLDEADEMLDMGFRDDIEMIISRVPSPRQTVLFSATMSPEILSLAGRFLKNPEKLQVVHRELTVPGIEQSYFEVRESMKVEVLTRLIDLYNPKLTLVFCNTKRRVDELVSHLQARGYPAEALHGDKNQAQRERVMAGFKKGTTDILVATDVAARGIDVEDISVVVNFDVPQDPEYYIHRIGRTARAGKTGRSFTFVSGKDVWKLRDIQRYAKIRIAPAPIPSDAELKEKRVTQQLEQARERLERGEQESYVPAIEQFIGEEYTSLDVAAALLRMITGGKKDQLMSETTISSDSSDQRRSEPRRSSGGAPARRRPYQGRPQPGKRQNYRD